jgi:hypothetical protein
MTRSPAPPPLAYDDWEPTKATLHLTTQIIGKVKLATHPKLPHWWHATLRVTPRGVSTQTIPVVGGGFELELDVHDLRLELRDSAGVRDGFALTGATVAEVYRQTTDLLDRTGHATEIVPRPYDNPHSDIPFGEDETHGDWDHDAILRWWRALLFIEEAFETFAGRSFMRTSPVQLFWHSFDIAVTRFTGRRSPAFGEGGRRSDIEAYSHEVISFGWWPGDPRVRFPSFYSYTAPEPDGLADHRLRPDAAWWQELESSHLAMLKYDDVRTADDPRGALLAFLENAENAGTDALSLDGADLLSPVSLWNELDQRFPRTRGPELVTPQSDN